MMSLSTPRLRQPIAALLLLPLTGIPAAHAADAGTTEAQIEALRQQVMELQSRVERLEGQYDQGVPVNPALKVQPVPGGWHKTANWKLLANGMTADRVVEILGAADNERSVSKFELWDYGDGKVRFYLGRLKSWDIPSGIDPE